MMRAAIYCRVSTEDQEKEGTSLDSQREACLAKAREPGYEVAEDFVLSETYSGLTLDRPKLSQLRQWVKDKEVDAVIAYTLDRLSRDPVHFIILQEELEKSGVELVLITETVDSSDLGKLITYIKGYAAKLEAEKIRERTMRGKRSRVEKYGKLPTGRGVLYGYNYDKERGINIANSCLDVVRMVGMWIIEEGIFLNEACRRLMAMGIPAPKGGIRWSRGTLGRIFRNPAYVGKTYAFKTTTVGNKRIRCPQERQVEIPNAVDRVPFNWDEWQVIQGQLDRNRELSPRNQKLSYLLRGMVFCKRDGRKYYGVPVHSKPYYRCSGRIKLLSSKPCDNRTVNAKWLEEAVWSEVEKVLRDPTLILAELQERKEAGVDVAHLEERIKLNCRQLDTLDEAETRYLRLYGVGVISSDKLEKECNRIKLERERIEHDNGDLENCIAEARELILNAERIKQVCDLVSINLASFTFEQKRIALEALSIRVWIDGDSVTVEGILPIPDVNIMAQPL
jgi:site-specific DNA recombinase